MVLEQLRRKKISRTALRKHCKKIEDDINALLEEFPADGIIKLKTLKLNYEAQILKINTVSDDIFELIADENDFKPTSKKA